MPDFQVIVSDPKTGRAYKVEVKGDRGLEFIGKKIGDMIDGGVVGLPGYKLRITGGSDKDGFPMRPDLPGTARRRILLTTGPGYRPKERGIRRRKSVRGREISADIFQINVKIEEYGHKPVEELLGGQTS
ncbi:MAG TPA: 30S ribosomal protein S6e [Methanomicrobia archaeon]|nr:30S ribosomal protein S6e [Methanomicrobia archaeon]HEX58899.1 30S ribosomal protein S6e [Methanomicrobia archaeon]